MPSFLSLGKAKEYIQGLQEIGIENPTEIQIKTIPTLLTSETDFVGLAQTGTGKTAAFGLPLLKHIDPDKLVIQALVLAPTRELAQQIKKQLFKFTKYIPHRIYTEGVYGGEKIEKQIIALERTTHVIVATPGRLLDLIERGKVDLSHLKYMVLDEADEMLNMGFKHDINKILRFANSSRKIWLFSATMPPAIEKLIKNYLAPDHTTVKIAPSVRINTNIVHQYIQTSISEKLNVLITLLEDRAGERAIVFCRTKAGARKLHKQLEKEGFSAGVLEGDMQQKERDKVMRAFKKGNLELLVATDVAARGLDVTDLSFIIHYQLPDQLDYYVHRSGRTARAGKEGDAIVLLVPEEQELFNEIERELSINFKHKAY